MWYCSPFSPRPSRRAPSSSYRRRRRRSCLGFQSRIYILKSGTQMHSTLKPGRPMIVMIPKRPQFQLSSANELTRGPPTRILRCLKIKTWGRQLSTKITSMEKVYSAMVGQEAKTLTTLTLGSTTRTCSKDTEILKLTQWTRGSRSGSIGDSQTHSWTARITISSWLTQ